MTATKPIRLVIADDADEARTLLRAALQRWPGVDVVAEAADGVEAVEQTARLLPDAVVLDVAMPRVDGLEAAAEIRRRFPSTRIVMLSAFSAGKVGQRAIDAGADVYLEKGVSTEELLSTIEMLCRRTPTQPPDRDRLVLDELEDAVIIVGRDRRVEAANAAASAVLGIPSDRVVGWPLAELFAGAVQEDGSVLDDDTNPVLAALTTGRRQSHVVVRLATHDGRDCWLAVSARPLLSPGGKEPRAVLASFSDAREQHGQRERLRLTTALVDDVVDAMSDGVAVLGVVRSTAGAVTGFRVDHLNRRAAAASGWQRGAMVEVDAASAGDPDDVAAAMAEAVEHHLDTATPRLRIHARDDTVTVVWPAAGAPMAQQLGRAPDTVESLLEAAVVASAEGIALVDSAGGVILANAIADRLLGGTALLGRPSPEQEVLRADTMAPIVAHDLPISRVRAGEAFDDLELFLTDKNRATGAYVKLSGRPVRDADGRLTGAVITVHDDTARKQSERALAAAHAELERSNAELEQYAYVASHDLSQPLRGIEGFAVLLDERYHGRLDAEADEWLGHITRSVDRMRTLINDLLTYSRVTTQAHPPTPVDLAELTEDVAAMFEQQIAESQAELVIDPLPTVLADRGQLAQVMQNLLANALTYVAPGVAPRVRISAQRVAGAWQITVADNGIGVATHDRQRAFAMFQRLVNADAYAGTGIGLAVARKVVERHGGSIWIEDNDGGGSRFCFTLPDPAVTPR